MKSNDDDVTDDLMRFFPAVGKPTTQRKNIIVGMVPKAVSCRSKSLMGQTDHGNHAHVGPLWDVGQRFGLVCCAIGVCLGP